MPRSRAVSRIKPSASHSSPASSCFSACITNERLVQPARDHRSMESQAFACASRTLNSQKSRSASRSRSPVTIGYPAPRQHFKEKKSRSKCSAFPHRASGLTTPSSGPAFGRPLKSNVRPRVVLLRTPGILADHHVALRNALSAPWRTFNESETSRSRTIWPTSFE